MIVLGIETATTVCGAALVVDGVVVTESSIAEKNVHAEKLLTMVNAVLEKSGLALTKVSGIAISIGPGSFTGLRIGLSVAKGLSYATGIPLVAVPTLEALARRLTAMHPIGNPGYVLPMIDARRDEVYCQLFRLEGEEAEQVWEERDRTLSEVLAELRGISVTVTGDANEKLKDWLIAGGMTERNGIAFADTELSRCSAATVALRGERLLQARQTEDPALLEPRYIKEFFFKSR